MGDQLVGVDLPDERGSQSTAPFTKVFWDCLPAYLTMGMSYETYFNGDPALAKAYREAWKIQEKNKQSYLNWQAWVAGGYIYHALCLVAPSFNSLKPQKPGKYPGKPYALDGEKTVQTEDKAQTFLAAWANKVNKKYERNT